MWLARGLATWVLVAALETLHGTARVLWLAPWLGEAAARPLGIVGALVIVFGVAWFTVRWIGARGNGQWLAVGAVWFAAMVGFDVAIGRWAFNLPWPRIAQDFNPAAGGWLGVAMLPLLVAPWLAARTRKIGV